MQELRFDTKHGDNKTIRFISSRDFSWKEFCLQSFPYFFIPLRRQPPPSVSAFEPDFVFPLENVTVAQGRDAVFTCVVNNLGGYRVSGSGSESGSTPARVRTSFVVACFKQMFLIVSCYVKTAHGLGIIKPFLSPKPNHQSTEFKWALILTK